MKPKKIPMRMCVGCRESKPKRELIRVVRAPDGTVSMDPGGKKARQRRVCMPTGKLPDARHPAETAGTSAGSAAH